MIDVDSSELLPPGQEGELCVKGPQVMKGYYKNQAATDDMIDSEGWLHTGACSAKLHKIHMKYINQALIASSMELLSLNKDI